MILKHVEIGELRELLIEGMKELEKYGYLRKCMRQFKAFTPMFKEVKYSEKMKYEGNEIYAQKNLDFAKLLKVMFLFNVSIAFAPNQSKELATAYANKSAVLLRMRKYDECITEIEKALKITESTSLKIKLLCRKVQCLTALGSYGNRSCLEKAKFIMSKFEFTEEERRSMNKLIEKTQSVIDGNKLDIPKGDKKKAEALKMIEEAEKRDFSKSTRVEYSEKYGRHLVAARDFMPGDIVLVEKPYINMIDHCRTYLYCDHCFKLLWSAVPCDHCPRRLYCSEQCKTEAWNQYHEMDCFVLSWTKTSLASDWNLWVQFMVSVFCKASREAGSIKQLLADFESSNQYKDEQNNSIPLITGSKDYKSIFTLPNPDLDEDDLEHCVQDSVSALICLAKYTKIFDKTYDFKEFKKLMQDDTAISVGALLLKLSIVLRGECPLVHLLDPNEADYFKNVEACNKFQIGRSNIALALSTMHTISGCVPNIESFPTYDNKFVIYAVRTMKEGDQLILNLKSHSIWKDVPKSGRQSHHKEKYGCSCECRACVENWSDTMNDPYKGKDRVLVEVVTMEGLEFWDERNSIVSDWKVNYHKSNYPDMKILSRITELVKTTSTKLRMPSPFLLRTVPLLMEILRAFHDPSEIFTKVQDSRKRELGDIIDFSHAILKMFEIKL